MARLAPRLLLAMVLLALPAVSAAGRAKSQERVPVRLEGVSVFPLKDVLAAAGLRRSAVGSLLGRSPTSERGDLEAEAEAVRLFYQRGGYFEATAVAETPQGEGPAVIRVVEGKPCRVGSVAVVLAEGTPAGEADAAVWERGLPIRSGEVFSVGRYEGAADVIASRLKEDGRPFAEVAPAAVVDLAAHSVAVTYTVKPGGRYTVGTVTFAGAAGAEGRILRRALAFGSGDVYRQSKVEASRDALYKLGLFQSVTFVNTPGKTEGTVDVLVRLKEGRLHRIRLGVGYGTEDRLRGQVRWETLRFARHTLVVGAEAKASAIDTRLQAYLRRPYVWDSKTTFLSDLTLGRKVEQDFRYGYVKAQAGLQRQIGPHFQGSAFLVLERVLQFAPDQTLDNAIKAGARDIATMASVAASLTYATTDAPLDPTRGSMANLYLEPTQVIGGGGPFFTKAILDGRQFVGLAPEWVLAFRLRVGGIYAGANRGEVPLTRRFYAGGANSIRGYAYNSLGPLSAQGALVGGAGLLESSAELRFPLKGGLRGVAFLDAGNATPAPFKFPKDWLRAGTGMGLRYMTPVGPVGLDLAWRLKKDPLNPSPYQVYFFIGYAF